jgi:hypothetical protein
MARCYARLDNGNKCMRNAKRLAGLCGTCHGITAEWKRCTQPVRRGKHCGRRHKTLEEIAQHRGASGSRRKASPRRTPRPRSTRSSSAAGKAGFSQLPPGEKQAVRRPGPRRPQQKVRRSPGSKRDLSKAAKREAAKLCANAILDQGVLAAFESQITEYVSEELMDELSRNWDGRQCEELAKLAQQLLAVKGYFYKVLQIIINWLMLRLGYGDTARFFVCQLVTALPVAWYAKLVAAARILQVTGICLCFMNDRSLTECKCLHDLVIFESKEAINRLMAAAVHNWREIAERAPETQSAQ